MDRTKNVFVVLLVWAFVTTVAHAQNTYEIVDMSEDAVVLRVAQGFTPWDFWAANADISVCSWVDFYPAVSALNPAEVATNFRTIAIGSNFRVPTACATGVVLAENIDQFSSVFASSSLRTLEERIEETERDLSGLVAGIRQGLDDRLDEQGQRIAVLEDESAKMSDELVALEASIESSSVELSSDDEAQGVAFWQGPAPWWVLLILLIALVAAMIVLWWRRRSEPNGQRAVWWENTTDDNLGRIQEENDKLREENAQLRDQMEQLESLGVFPEGHVEHVEVRDTETGELRTVRLKHEPPYVTAIDGDDQRIFGPMHRDNALVRLQENQEEQAQTAVDTTQSEKPEKPSSGNKSSKTRRGGKKAHERRQRNKVKVAS